MKEIIDKVIAILLFICLAAFAPIMLISMRVDQSMQTYMDTAVIEFVDNARVVGAIYPSEYEKFISDIDNVQAQCEIEICVTRMINYFDISTGQYENYPEEIYKSQILNILYPDYADPEPYFLKKGDTITVTVKNTTPTLGEQLFLLSSKSDDTPTIFAKYSGMVGNYIE